jgi:hypothetical protein
MKGSPSRVVRVNPPDFFRLLYRLDGEIHHDRRLIIAHQDALQRLSRIALIS